MNVNVSDRFGAPSVRRPPPTRVCSDRGWDFEHGTLWLTDDRQSYEVEPDSEGPRLPLRDDYAFADLDMPRKPICPARVTFTRELFCGREFASLIELVDDDDDLMRGTTLTAMTFRTLTETTMPITTPERTIVIPKVNNIWVTPPKSAMYPSEIQYAMDPPPGLFRFTPLERTYVIGLASVAARYTLLGVEQILQALYMPSDELGLSRDLVLEAGRFYCSDPDEREAWRSLHKRIQRDDSLRTAVADATNRLRHAARLHEHLASVRTLMNGQGL